MLRKHERKYIQKRTKKPKVITSGCAEYQFWSNMWPQKDVMMIGSLRLATGTKRFALCSPTDIEMLEFEETPDRQYKITYQWIYDLVSGFNKSS